MSRISLDRSIYLDHNATTRPLEEVVEAVARTAKDHFANPGSRHAFGRSARRVLEECREQIAAILGAQPDEVCFTSGGTEANNLAVKGLLKGTAGTILLSPGEHPSIEETCRGLQQQGWRLRKLPVDDQGRLVHDRGELDSLAAESPIRLLTFLLAHNEIGVIQETSLWADFCETHRVPWHLDGVQAVGKIPVDFAKLRCTSLSFGAHKFHGPRGIGGLLIRHGTRIVPQLTGGHQEHQHRAGTEAVALIAGMKVALQCWHQQARERMERLTQLRAVFEARIRELCSPIVIHGEQAQRLPNTSNISFPGLDGEALLVACDLAGIACSLGSTCASGSAEPAPILMAMGCPPEIFKSAVRFSCGITNSREEIIDAANRIGEVVSRMRKLAAES